MSTHPPHRLVSHLKNVSNAYISHTSVPYTLQSLGITSVLLRHGLLSSISLGDTYRPNPTAFPTLAAPEKRLWINMKYRSGIPVMRHFDLVSKGSQKVRVDRDELGRLLSGKRVKNSVQGVGIGELLIVRTERNQAKNVQGAGQYLEGWEAWRAGVGGDIVARVA